MNQDEAAREALRALEAAGIEGQAAGSHEEQAAFHLAHAVAIRTERAEREAEDAKVRALRDLQTRAAYPEREVTHWDDITIVEKVEWRARFRAAREFFTRDEHEPISVEALAKALGHELPEQDTPRVIQSADDLSLVHESSEWGDHEGDVWSHRGRSWGYAEKGRGVWIECPPCTFPWTEVLS